MATQIENAQLVSNIVAHYVTASGLRRHKEFKDAASFNRWEKSVERMGYYIEGLDVNYMGGGRAGNVQTDFVGPPEYKLVHNARFGGMQWERKDTPWSCSVASEAYWQN